MARLAKITFLIIILLISTGIIFQFALDERIPWGVRVNGVDLGELTRTEAEKKLRPLVDLLEQRTLYFYYENRHWSLDPELIGFKVDLDKTLEDAYAIGRKSNLIDSIKELYVSIFDGRNLTLKVHVDAGKLARVLNTLDQEVHVRPKSVELEIVDSRVTILRKSIEGRELQIKETQDQLNSILASGGNKITLVVKKIQPRLSNRILEQMRPLGLLSSFITNFKSAERERSKNIEIAAESIKGYVMQPGDIFSFNQVVGPRSEEDGYKKAMVIINNKFVPDWGGGVCQVSTTLYNAALLADMGILKRKEHSRPVKYIPPGQGSTVAFGLIDFQIRNPLPKPVIIWTKFEKENVIVYFLGKKDPGKEVIIESTDFKEITPAIITKESDQILKGKELVEEEGANGYQVTTWRIVKRNGKTIRRELLAKDRVEAIDRVIVIGIKEPSP